MYLSFPEFTINIWIPLYKSECEYLFTYLSICLHIWVFVYIFEYLFTCLSITGVSLLSAVGRRSPRHTWLTLDRLTSGLYCQYIVTLHRPGIQVKGQASIQADLWPRDCSYLERCMCPNHAHLYTCVYLYTRIPVHLYTCTPVYLYKCITCRPMCVLSGHL